MREDQIDALIRRHSLFGEADADYVSAIARSRGVTEYALRKARKRLGYTRTVQTAIGRRWAK
jgi:hypothetical protein